MYFYFPLCEVEKCIYRLYKSNSQYSIMNSDDERLSKKIMEQQQEEKLKNTMYQIVKDIAKELEINTSKVGAVKKSTPKRLVKYKMKKKIERLKKEMEDKTKSRTIKEDKWKMKDYILNSNGEEARDAMLTRLHMWNVQMNYRKEKESVLCPLCESM